MPIPEALQAEMNQTPQTHGPGGGQFRFRRHRLLADYETSLPPHDAATVDPGNPRRFRRSTTWKKVMEAVLFGTGFAPGSFGNLG